MAEIFNVTFLNYIEVLIVAILIYAIIYSLLRKLEIFGEKKEVSAVIALAAAVIVSFSGVVTYTISYAINWFVIIFFIVFLLMVLLMFLGVSQGDITSKVKDNAKIILVVFGILFLVIFLKSFFALNNTFDTSNPPDDKYEINTSYNTGVDDMTGKVDNNFLTSIFNSVDRDIWASVLFLLVLGIFVFFIGRE